MSGHSKWSTIKRAKAVNDAKKGAIFTKISNLITMAVKEKGSDIDSNFTLRMAIDKAKVANMPKDNIERAIKRGTGELAGDQIEELYYEGIGPVNSQFIVKCLTDNKNRSASSIRHIFSKYGGALSSVMWNFDKRGVISFKKAQIKDLDIDKEVLELELIDTGAEDIKIEDEDYVIYTQVSDLQTVKEVLENKNINIESADLNYIAKDEQAIPETDRDKVENFVNALEDDEDVSDYYTNLKL
ncbi:MAG TPA: YebC/PmpR family DNA-binding transcriptional regulator [Patescibacteria group bacterium]|nr:YebC/PmpR family DNA-binding transcriptional regulator [Patescibacteria group bacterium]